MAKKPEAKSATETQRREVAEAEIPLSPGERVGVRADKKIAKPSSLLDTRVVYCGDNVEQTARMQKEESRMMKPVRSAILPSSFILLNSPVPASHYVKVMLDQIFGNN